ncbi:MAG TPA: hypothetical protein VG146_07395 [Verrucomicrobiae bacterium]|nr:hypothetical protein [Verrucomicrobiae bacterium]
MKTNPRAWQLYQIRIWAGLGLILVLALASFGRVFRFEATGGAAAADPERQMGEAGSAF